MSWMQKLYETYEANVGNRQREPLLPVNHSPQRAHIEIVLDGSGSFRRASVLNPADEIVIPVTEESSGRTTNNAPHALCDKIQYVAGDYETFGGRKKPYFESYLKGLENWCESPHRNAKAQAVLNYIRKRHVVADLVKEGILHAENGNLLTTCPAGSKPPTIFRVLPKDAKNREDGKPIQDQGNAFVRWRVEIPGAPESGTWEDSSLVQSWIGFVADSDAETGLCLVTGENDRPIARIHPKRLRHGADGARLISSNDEIGYTFRGRFQFAEEAATVASDVTQKAHSALRWLITRQGYQNGTQTIVSWAVSGKSVPDPLADSDMLFCSREGCGEPESDSAEQASMVGDIGQAFARRLSRMIAGYKADLGPKEDIVVIGLDSATPGRMAITFYRELKGSEFLDRISGWHETYAWFQDFSTVRSVRRFVGAPAPHEVAAAVFEGHQDDDKDKKISRATVERLLPCIMDGRQLPRDLMEAAVRRASHRVGMDRWEWEKTLGIACSLFRGFHKERRYGMGLDRERRTRDYLYGRLLAIAERLEGHALYLADENRDTTTARLMQRFADHPFTTWRNIENGLQPYKSRLQAKSPKFLFWIKGLLDEVHDLFAVNDFTDDRPLSGEFLLGYHCQRRELYQRPPDVNEHENQRDQPSK